jgi:hypothetical protein
MGENFTRESHHAGSRAYLAAFESFYLNNNEGLTADYNPVMQP